MKPLVIFSYVQPVHGRKFRFGVLLNRRDTVKYPLWLFRNHYRENDKEFKRSRTLDTILTTEGPKQFYRERQNFHIEIPFIGSLVERFIRA